MELEDAPTIAAILVAEQWKDYLARMDTMNADTGPLPSAETDSERQSRIAWEAERIAEARASVAAGRVISSERVDAWLDSLGTDHELPAPHSGR